jgi:hypothetical protein
MTISPEAVLAYPEPSRRALQIYAVDPRRRPTSPAQSAPLARRSRSRCRPSD